MMSLYHKITSFFLSLQDPYQLSDKPQRATIWPYLKSHLALMRWLVFSSIICTILLASLEVWLIYYSGQLVDVLLSHAPAEIWQKEGFGLALAAVIILVVRPLLSFLCMSINDIAIDCNSLTMSRWQAFDYLTQQSVGWFQEDLTGRTSSRLLHVGEYVANIVHAMLNSFAFGFVYVIGIILVLSQVDLWLSVPVLLWLCLYIICIFVAAPFIANTWHDFSAARSTLFGTIVDHFSNFDIMILFGTRTSILREQQQQLENTRQAMFHARKVGVSLNTGLTIAEGALMTGFLGYVIYLWSNEAVTPGIIAASIALTFRITAMADAIFDYMRSVFLHLGSLREALHTIGQPIAIPQAKNAPTLKVREGAISIHNLSHHYGLKENGLKSLTLKINAGEKIGIVGRSGAGKSTLVNLILRFFEAEKGRIEIDQQNIANVDQESLRASIGMITQQAALLNRSIRDNILLGYKQGYAGGDDEMLIKAAKQAQAHDFIMGLEDNQGRAGYDAHVGERGVKLSGGQKQRIALARVFLKDAPILILDEATSALDSEVEAAIQEALTQVMENKTVIAIAHRLSTIVQMDRIIVLDNGQIVEEGNHKDLLAKDGLYASFWKRQSGAFINASLN